MLVTDEGDIRSGIAGRTPEERADVEGRARRIRGQHRFVRGFASNNVASSGLLPVCGCGFTLDELKPKAACRVIRVKYRRVFRTGTGETIT